MVSDDLSLPLISLLTCMQQCKFEEDNNISNENTEESGQEEGDTSEYESEEPPSDDSEDNLEEVCLYFLQFSFVLLRSRTTQLSKEEDIVDKERKSRASTSLHSVASFADDAWSLGCKQ